MQPSSANPNKSAAVIIAHIQSGLIAIAVFLIFRSMGQSFYDGGFATALNGLVVVGIIALLAPVNLIIAGYFLVKKRRSYPHWVTVYVGASLVVSVLILAAVSRIQ